MFCEKSLFDSLFSSESCVFCHCFRSPLKKCLLWLYIVVKQGYEAAPRQCEICSKLELSAKSFPYKVIGTLTAYAWLQCAYAYACMRVHTLEFPAAFLFQKQFYSFKNKLYFTQTFSSSQFSRDWTQNQPWALENHHYWGTKT